jgi:hydrogenase maturation factor HypF (carbamoyltransferase family)
MVTMMISLHGILLPIILNQKINTTKPVEYAPQEPKEKISQAQEQQAEHGVKMQTSTCPKCSQQMEIWSKYGYFWKCTACGKTVAIKEKCPNCNGNLKLRKQKNQYFLGCKDCNIEGLYHEIN